MTCRRPILTLTVFIHADFLGLTHTQRAHAPNSAFSLHAQLHILLPVTSHSLECSQVQTQTPVVLCRLGDGALTKSHKSTSAAHIQVPICTETCHRSMQTQCKCLISRVCVKPQRFILHAYNTHTHTYTHIASMFFLCDNSLSGVREELGEGSVC